MLMMPLIAAGAAAGTIPIIVHLLHRQKTTPIAWGAMQFLLGSPLKQKRRERIDHWLLMLCRIALLVLLAIMLARPLILESKFNPFATNTAADIAVVVDHSLSMSRTGDQTLFEHSIAQVQKIAGLMRQDDSLSIVLAEHTPSRLNDRPVTGSGDIAELLDSLHQEVKPNNGLTDASIPDAVQAARNLINHGGNIRKIIIVISDEQRSGWLVENQTAWRNAVGGLTGLDRSVDVYALPVNAAITSPDVSVSGMNITPAFLGIGRPVQITAVVANSGPGDMPAFPLTLTVDGRAVGNQQVIGLGAGQSQTIRFDHTFTDAGSHWIKIQADVVDALDADNSCIAAVNVSPKLPVLIIDGQLTGTGSFESSVFLQAAMQPEDPSADASTLVDTKIVSTSEAASVPLNNYLVVVVNDVPELTSEMAAKLNEFALSGHGVWFILGPKTNPLFFNSTLSKMPLFPLTIKERRLAPALTPTAGTASIDVKDPDSPMVSMLLDAERNAFTGVALNQWWAVDPNNADERVVLATSNGDPLLLEHVVGTGGRIAIWTSSIDGQWNNLPLVTNFVPLVNETLYHLASGPTKGLNRRLDSGGNLFWSGPSTPPVESARITHPDATVHKADPMLSSDGHWIINYSDTYTPGLYELRFLPTDIPQPIFYSVNIDPRELDPAVLSASDIGWLKDNGYVKDRITADALTAAIGAENRGTELWPYLAIGVLGMLILETFLTRRIVRLQVRESADAAILMSAGVHGSGGTV